MQNYSPSSDNKNLYKLAKNVLEKPKVLQDLALISVPESLMLFPDEARQRSTIVQSALSVWEEHVREDDLRFGFEERCWIPRIEIYIPDTPDGKKFFKIAKAIGDIPMQSNILPKNQEQAYWLKTLHYFYQARGVLFAYKLLGKIPDPIGAEGVFKQHFSESIIRNLNLITEVDIAEYKLIIEGESYFKAWILRRQEDYPFKHPFQLLLKIQKQAFCLFSRLRQGNLTQLRHPNFV
jgi:hypothetical protein